jgi:hypothetical protein
VVLASSEKFPSGVASFFFIIIIIPVEPSFKETATWQIQIRFPHIFCVSFFTCVVLHVSCYPIIFSLLLCFGEGLAERLNVKFFFFFFRTVGGGGETGGENGDVEQDGGVGEFVPLCYGARGWSGKLQQTNLVAIQGRKLSPTPLVSHAPCTGPAAPRAQEDSFSSVLVNF